MKSGASTEGPVSLSGSTSWLVQSLPLKRDGPALAFCPEGLRAACTSTSGIMRCAESAGLKSLVVTERPCA